METENRRKIPQKIKGESPKTDFFKSSIFSPLLQLGQKNLSIFAQPLFGFMLFTSFSIRHIFPQICLDAKVKGKN